MQMVWSPLPSTQISVWAVPSLRAFSPLNLHRLIKPSLRSLLHWMPCRASFLPTSISKALSSLVLAGSEVYLFLAQLSSAVLQDVSFTSAIQPGQFPMLPWNMSVKGCSVSWHTALRSRTYQPSDSWISPSTILRWPLFPTAAPS